MQEIGQRPIARNALERRDRLPNRRPAISTSFERDGARFEMTAGFYPDGRPGKIFLGADRANSLLDFLMSDAAILASLAMQYGAPRRDQTRLEARQPRQCGLAKALALAETKARALGLIDDETVGA